MKRSSETIQSLPYFLEYSGSMSAHVDQTSAFIYTYRENNKVARNGKRKKNGFLYSKNMENFEVFH